MQSSSDMYIDQQELADSQEMLSNALDSLQDKLNAGYRTKLRILKAYITNAYLSKDNYNTLKEALDFIDEELNLE